MVEVVVTDEFAAWYAGLTDLDGDAVFAKVAQLEAAGTQLGFPASSALKGSKYTLRELRIKAGGDQIRIAYAFDPKRNAVLILGGTKAGDDRFYEWFIPQSETVWKQYLAEQETP